jgi:ribonuclease D
MIALKITKEEVNQLDLGAFLGEIILVNEEEDFRQMLEDLSSHKFIGFDTETRPAFRRGVSHDVSLLQFSTQETAYLVRLNEVGFRSEVKKILEDPNIIKIGAAVRDDLKGLKKLNPAFEPKSFFDLNEELRKVGFLNVGVRNLSAMVLGIRISKSEQVSNWEAQALTEKQLLYAATDAWACLEIFLKLYKHGYLDGVFSM